MSDEEQECVEESDLPDGVEDELKTKYGPLITLDAGALGAFAFKRASQAVHEKLVNELADSKEKAQAIRSFALNCLVYPVDANGKPDYSAGRALFEASPGAPSELLEAIQGLAAKLTLKKR